MSVPPGAEAVAVAQESGPIREAGEDESRKGRSDAELLLRVKEDPARGAALFYARFREEVNRLVWRLLGADADHHDIVQQVFLKALRGAGRLREPERMGAWVQAITVNTVYEELRKREVRRLFLRDTQPRELYPNLVHDVEVRDFLRSAKALVERLPAKERIVFMLHFVEGKTLAEIAVTCDFSLATAKRRLAGASRRFSSLVARNRELASFFQEREPGAGEGGA